MTEDSDGLDPSPGTSVEKSYPDEESSALLDYEIPNRAGILKRAESTDDSTQLRRCSMRNSDSLDSSRPNGILKRKRSCLAKTVSFSNIVSELILPPRPLPLDMGEYIETDFSRPDTKRPEPVAQRPREASVLDEEARLQRLRQQEIIRERRMRNVDPGREPSTSMKIRNELTDSRAPQLTVEELPQDEDPDEFKIPNVYKCGNCTVVFSTGKNKKMRFLTLTERCLEFHSSEKTFRAGRSSKYVVDLAMAFNVHDGHYDAKIKYCLCLMTPDETICMRPEGGFTTVEGWKRALTKAIHESRRKKMDRVPRPEDLFDAAWDIDVCATNRKSKEHSEEGMTNICKAHENLKGKKRLCIYPHHLAIVDMCIEPTPFGLPPAGFPPFRSSNMFILQRSWISWYGHDSGFFWIGIGGGCSYKGYEILFQVENDVVAKEILTRIEFLAARDIEKKKRDQERDTLGMESLSVPSSLMNRTKLSLDSPILTARDRRLMLGRECLSFASLEKDDSAPSSPFANYSRPRGSLGNFQIDHLSRLDQPRGSIHSLGNMPIERQRLPTALNLLKARDDSERKHSTQSERFELVAKTQVRKTSDNRAMNTGSSSVNPPQAAVHATPIPLTMQAIADDKQDELEPEDDDLKRRREEARQWCRDFELAEKKGFKSEHSPLRTPALGPSSYKSSPRAWKNGDWRKLEECSADDLSDSGDSCYSSRRGTESRRSRPLHPHLACQMPNRAQSFGAKQLKFPNRLPPTVNLPDTERKISAAVQGSSSNQLDLPQDDPRKRAFSLGSRNFFNIIGLNDFRRLVGKRHRTTSPNQTSTSGISLNSSNPSPSASSNFLASSEYLEHTRTESFGSARSSPSKGNSTQRVNSPKESDLMSIDFSQLGKKKNSITDTRRFPFGGSGPGGSMDYNRERQEKEEAERREREQLAIDLKKQEQREAQELAAKKREAERKVEEKKQRKLEKELEKERERGLRKEKKEEKDRDHEQDKDFRPKADSGIADCTPSSSFSGKKDGKTQDGRDSSYVDAEGLKFLADIKKKKKKKEQEASATSSSSSLNTIVSNEDNKSRKAPIEISKAIGAVNINRRSSACAELNRKPSICTAILEENEGIASETESRGEPSDQKASVATGGPAPITTRKTASTGSSLSPFRRLKFLNFRWNS